MKSRRQFLKRCCTFGACGAAAHLTRFGLMTAQAQSTSSYKALVCIFMFGGNDSNNMIVPLSGSGNITYAGYAGARGALALAQNAVLPIGANNGAVPYGLHPALTRIQQLYLQKKAAMAFNVGTLVAPTTMTQIKTGNPVLPRNLYSHSDQTQQWQTANPTQAGGTGWGGRITDVVANGTPVPGRRVGNWQLGAAHWSADRRRHHRPRLELRIERLRWQCGHAGSLHGAAADPDVRYRRAIDCRQRWRVEQCA